MKLWARDLACVRGERPVFAGLNFEVAAGEALLLTGPNGSGKSSLLRLLAGFLRPEAGAYGLDGGEADTPLREQVHLVAHLDAVKPQMSVTENLAFWAKLLGADESRVTEALSVFDLERLMDLPAAYLSAGQKRRLGLSRLVLASRPVWLLDEPSVSLDAENTERLAKLMHAHVQGGGLLVAATHIDLGLPSASELRLGKARP